MRVPALVNFFAVLFCFVTCSQIAFAQTPKPIATTAVAPENKPVRDSEGLAILEKAVIAAGGSQSIRQIKDFTASGKITRYGGEAPVSNPVELYGRGLDQLKMNTDTVDGPHVIVVNHGVGKIVTQKQVIPISPMNSSNLSLVNFPAPFLAAALNDTHANVSFMGIEKIGNSSAYVVRIIRGVPERLLQDERFKKIRSSEVLIDSTNSLILAVRHPFFGRAARAREVLRQLEFADFRQVNGLIIPFTVNEKMGGQSTWTISLSKINFNVGLTDDNFKP